MNNYSLLDNNSEFLANKFEANRFFRLCQERLAPHKNTVKKAIRYQAVNDETYEWQVSAQHASKKKKAVIAMPKAYINSGQLSNINWKQYCCVAHMYL